MFNFTKQERFALSVVALMIFSGMCIDYTFKKYPSLKDSVNLIDGDELYHKVDINSATKQELIDIPYIGEYTAGTIIDYRGEKGLFKSVEELKQVKGIKEGNYKKFKNYITTNPQSR